MGAKFTKGPWGKVCGDGTCDIFVDNSDIDEDGNYVACEIPEASAHLIAAAPDMYAVLAQVESVFSEYPEDTEDKIVELWEKVIAPLLAKARGESNDQEA